LLEVPQVVGICGYVDSEDENPEPGGGDPVIDPQECEGMCRGHIDILFLIPQAARDWIGPFPDPYLDLVASDLRTSFENSNIVHTISYQYVDVSYNDFGAICQEDAFDANLDQELLDVLSNYSSDIGILLAPPSFYSVFGCVASGGIGPNSSSRIAIIPADNLLFDHTFPHEVGHLLGAEHQLIGTGRGRISPNCASAKSIIQNQMGFGTIMFTEALSGRIPHFSNPNVDYYGASTGDPEVNNAGYINLNGCLIGDYNTSDALQPQVDVSVNDEDCVLELSVSHSSSTISNFTYEWYWNTSGFFFNYTQSSSLGTGQNLTIADPYPFPCKKYFIHLRILNNGIVVATQTEPQDGGICTENVWCGGSGGANLIIKEPSSIFEGFNSIIVNALGVVVASEVSDEIDANSLNLAPGIYYRVRVNFRGILQSRAFLISQF